METTYLIGDWLVDPKRNTLTRAGEAREISKAHMRVLVALIESEGEQISKSSLLEKVWNARASEDNVSVAISHIRKALDDNAKRPKYIHDSSGYYALLKPVVVEKDRVKSTKPRRSFPSIRLLLALLVFLLLIKGFMIRNSREQKAEEPAPLQTLVLLPLKNSAEADELHFQTDALTENLIAELSKQDKVTIISAASAMTYKNREISPQQIAEELSADTILQGSVSAVKNRIKVYLELLQITPDIPGGELVWTKEIMGTIEEPLALQNRILKVLWARIDSSSNHRPDAETAARISEIDYLAYLQARELLKTRDPLVIAAAAQTLEELIAKAPSFPDPYLDATVARSLLLRSDPIAYTKALPELKGRLERAIELDPHSARAYTALGSIHFLSEWNFASAEKYFLAAAKVAPQDRNTHYWLSQFYLAFAQFDRALFHLDKLKQLDPLSYSKSYAAWILNMAGQYDAALAEMEKLAVEQPGSLQLYTAYIKIYENMAREDEAFTYYLRVFSAYGYSAKEQEAAGAIYEQEKLAGLNRWLAFEKFEQRDVGQYEPPLSIGRYCAAASQKNLAFDWLTKAWNTRQRELLWINVDPKYDILRSDPRFEKLVEEMGLNYRPAQQEEP